MCGCVKSSGRQWGLFLTVLCLSFLLGELCAQGYNFDSSQVHFTIDELTYSNTEKVARFSVDGHNLQEGQDYVITYRGDRQNVTADGFSARVDSVHDLCRFDPIERRFTITPREIDILVPEVQIPFDGAPHAYPRAQLSINILPNDRLPSTISNWGTQINVGRHHITFTIPPGGNYTGQGSGYLTIYPTASAIAIRDTTFIYNGLPQTPRVEFRTSPDSFTTVYLTPAGVPLGGAPKDIGTYVVSVRCDEYAIDVRDTFTIAPKFVELTFPPDMRPYDGAEHTYDSSLIVIEALEDGDPFPTLTVVGEKDSEVGYYSVSATIDPGQNYVGDADSNALWIVPSKHSIVITNTRKIYHGEPQTASITFRSGDPDSFSIVYLDSDGLQVIDSPRDAGCYTVAVVSEFYPTAVTDSLLIHPARVFVTADTHTITFGDPLPALTYTHSPLCGTDTFHGELSVAFPSAPDTYPITIGTLSADSNYRICFNGGYIVVLPVPYEYIGIDFGQPTTVSASDLGLKNLRKIPKVTATYIDAAKRVTRSTRLYAKTLGVNALALKLQRAIRLYSPRGYKLAKRHKTLFSSELFDLFVAQDSTLLTVSAGHSDSTIDLWLYPPQITDTPIFSWNGKYVMLLGQHFGTKPKVWMEYASPKSKKIVRKRLKIAHNPANAAEITTLYLKCPKKWPEGDVEIVIDNQFGLGFARFAP